VLRLDHGGGVTTRYAHLRSALVKGGELVSAGMAIATVGSSGLATGPHLHYEVRVRGDAVDPLRTRVVAGR
jgi:murein DD-endopeptidase MepM/ murein hydrolase activator NlpD